MKILETTQIAIKAVSINKMRAFLTMLGVIIGGASVVLLISIGNGIKSYITKQFEELGSNLIIVMPGKVSVGQGGDPTVNFVNSKLSETEAENLRRYVPSILEVSIESGTKNPTLYKNNKYLATIYVTDENFSEVTNFKVERGRFFNKAEAQGAERVAVIEHTIVDKLFKNSDPIGKQFSIEDKKFRVLGIYEKRGAFGGSDMDALITIPFKTAKLEFNISNISSINIKVKDNTDVTEVKREISKVLLRTLKKDDFTILGQEELLSSISSILGTITLALSGIAAISLLVGGIGIMNIVLVSVTERTHEIGLRKSLGATPNNLLSQFLAEAIILSAIGGFIGILISIASSLLLNNFISTKVTSWSVIWAFAFSILVGIIFGTYPAYKAAKKNPIDALRYE